MVFSSKDSTITDEDIDRIIAKGEEATAELDAKMKKFTEDAIKFKMDDSMLSLIQTGLCLMNSVIYQFLVTMQIHHVKCEFFFLFLAAAELYDFDDDKVATFFPFISSRLVLAMGWF